MPILFRQVLALTVRSSLSAEAIATGVTDGEVPYTVILNRLLPDDIRVLGWAPVDYAFNARFGCLHRTYRYFFVRGTRNIEVRRAPPQPQAWAKKLNR